MSLKKTRGFFALFAVLIYAVFLAGCNNGTAESESVDETNILSVKEIIQKLADQSGGKNLNSFAFFDDDIFKNNCEKLYGISYEELNDGGIVFAGNGGLADEVTILKSKDGNIKKLTSILESRIERRIGDFTGYKPTEISKIEKADAFECGGFAILIISDNGEALKHQIKAIIS